jgi:acyl-CoA reductase-like NAD-dependent aldehyde dehydrogenase
MASDLFLNFIQGQWVPAASGKTFQNINPADQHDVIGLFPSSDAQDVARAVQSAKKALKDWIKVPPPKKGEILFRTGSILEKRKEELAVLMTREMGKVLKETRGDIQEAIDMAYYMGGEGRRLFGQTVPSELPNKFCMTLRQPLGVCGLITPWNFPMAIPSWKIFPALMCGNTAVIKPASDTPASTARLVEILLEAGLPPETLQLVHGAGLEAGEALVAHPDVDLISFTGASETGFQIGQKCARDGKRVCLEMGGKNAQIVLSDADLDLAVEGVLWGAFGTAGQRCTATSRLILQENLAQDFIRRVVEKAKQIVVGNGLNPKTQMGPLVNQSQLKKVAGYVQAGIQEGAQLLCGGEALKSSEHERGHFFQPTVFGGVKPGMKIEQEEIFGPVLGIIQVKDFDEAIRVANGTQYGLSISIYTRDVNKAYKAIQGLQAGIVYVNAPTIGAEVQLPFGGVKNTGNGHREAGVTALDIFSEWKTVFVDYSGSLQKAQITES